MLWTAAVGGNPDIAQGPQNHKNIEKHKIKIECLKPYQKCINASFSGFDFLFKRWFNPEADCKNY